MRRLGKRDKESRLLISIILNIAITIVEIFGATLAGSLALISDALHNFSDAASLIISFFALKLTRRKHTPERTFGYRRAEILAALFNATVLIIVSFFLFKEAASRFITPPVVNAKIMIAVALIGFSANFIAVILLKRDAQANINIRSAYLHLFFDTLSSVAVIAGAGFVYFFKVYWIDPLLTVLIGIYVIKEGFNLVSESIHILMQNTPKEIDLSHLQRAIEAISSVKNIHHVHAWSITEQDIHFEAHINLKEDIKLSECCSVKAEIEKLLRERFNIKHTILQFEYDLCQNIPLIKQ